MDSVFFLDEEVRTRFLQNLAQSLGCTYICLWFYHPPPSNYLFSTNGVLNYNAIASSSSASISSQTLVQTLFDAYRSETRIIQNGLVPGLAFAEGIPYLEFKELELINRASTDIQRQFYQESRIKLAAFVGCKTGEMEIGMSTLDQSKNIEMEMMNWFPDDFIARQSKLITSEQAQLPHRIDQSWPSSSSSSLKSLVSSPEYSPLLLNAAPNAFFPLEFMKQVTPADHQTSKPYPIPAPSIEQQIEHYPYNILGNVQFPNPENVDAEITRAMLAVLSSSSSSSHQHQHQHQQTQAYGYHLSQEMGAFRRYKPEDNLIALASNKMKSNHGGQDMLKRAIVFYKSMHMRKRIMEEQLSQGSRPTSSQLHHKMSERKRREKLNDSFLALKSLLPPGSKKDKVSLLSTTRDYLTTLKDEITELKRRNRFLEAQLAATRHMPITSSSDREMGAAGTSSDDPVDIQLTQISEPSSEEREINLQVSVRSGHYDFISLIRRLLEFLNQIDGVPSLEFIEGNTTPSQEPNSSCRVVFRLKIKANQQQIFEESAFKEALRRIIGDLAK